MCCLCGIYLQNRLKKCFLFLKTLHSYNLSTKFKHFYEIQNMNTCTSFYN